MEAITIKKIGTRHPRYDAVFALRDKILRQPLGRSLSHEDTSGDAEDVVFIGLSGETLTACVMYKKISAEEIKLRQMAVDGRWQQHGIGKMLVLAVEEDAAANQYKRVSLHARKSAVGFYEKLGYTVYGGEFDEVGIPHVAMEKIL